MEVVVAGIFIDMRGRFWKARSPMRVTESGMVTDDSRGQPKKARVPMVLTTLLSTTDVS